jgi:hypothetical protein
MFSRFLELSLSQPANAGCVIGIIATTFAVHTEALNESGGHGYAYGIVGQAFPRAGRSDAAGCPAEERPKVAAAMD